MLATACFGASSHRPTAPATVPQAAVATASPATSASDGAVLSPTSTPFPRIVATTDPLPTVRTDPSTPVITNAAPAAAPVRPTNVAPTPSIAASPPPPRAAPTAEYRPPPELTGLSNWFNSAPVTIAGLIAERRVVLVDFWTYTCINCVRTLPFLKIWDDRYRTHGLTIIGVHSPEFEFEKDPANVERAVKSFGLGYPIAQDNEMATWGAFNNNRWPAKYLIDADGNIPYRHFGEGDYALIERHIRLALESGGWDLSGVPEGGYAEPARDPDAVLVTTELYGGYQRNYGWLGSYAGQDAYYEAPDRTHLYVDDGPHRNNHWYLNGLWRNESEAIVHARTTTGYEDYIGLLIAGRSVNIVIRPERPGNFDVAVEIDGRPLSPAEAGEDISFDALGRSILTVDSARLYQAIMLPKFGIHEIRFLSNSNAFAVYAFTFGGYQEGA